MIGWIGHVSHHLGSLLGGIYGNALTVLCGFVCGVGYFGVCSNKVDSIVVQVVGGLTYWPPWVNACN